MVFNLSQERSQVQNKWKGKMKSAATSEAEPVVICKMAVKMVYMCVINEVVYIWLISLVSISCHFSHVTKINTILYTFCVGTTYHSTTILACAVLF